MSREIDEELQAHIEEAVEQRCRRGANGFGSALRRREESGDIRLIGALLPRPLPNRAAGAPLPAAGAAVQIRTAAGR